MKWLALMALLLWAAAGGAADGGWRKALEQQEIGEDEFTRLVSEAIVERDPSLRVVVEAPLELTIRRGDEDFASAFLHNLHRSLSSDPAERLDQVERYLSSLSSSAASVEISSEHVSLLRPVVRDEIFVEQARARFSEDDPLVAEPWVANLWLLYALDWPDRIQYLRESDLASLGIEREKLHGVALENFAIAAKETLEIEGVGPIFMLALDGSYESSVLLLDSLWKEVEEQLEGQIVAAVPVRDVVAFTTLEEPEAVLRLRLFAVKAAEQGSYPITTRLITRRGGKWQALD